MPPALAQSGSEVYCEKSPLMPDGLADGEVDGEVVEGVADGLPDPPGAVLPPPDVPVPDVPEPLPDAPEPLPDAPGLPALEPPPDEPLPLPPPLPDCAAATTGARAMMPIMMAPTYLRIL